MGLLGRPAEALLPELSTWADQINPGFRTYDAAYVDAVHQLGMEVHTYTVNQATDMHLVLDRGVSTESSPTTRTSSNRYSQSVAKPLMRPDRAGLRHSK